MGERERTVINLTDDPLTNIYIMAPLLDTKEQASVYGLIYGLFMSDGLRRTETVKQET